MDIEKCTVQLDVDVSVNLKHAGNKNEEYKTMVENHLEERITNCFRKCIKSIEAIMDSFDDWVLLYDVSVNLKHAGNKNEEYKTMVENQSYLEERIVLDLINRIENTTDISLLRYFYTGVDDLFSQLHDREEVEESNELLDKLSLVEYAIVKRISYLERTEELA